MKVYLLWDHDHTLVGVYSTKEKAVSAWTAYALYKKLYYMSPKPQHHHVDEVELDWATWKEGD